MTIAGVHQPEAARKPALARPANLLERKLRLSFEATGGTSTHRLCIAKQNSRRPLSSAALRPLSLRSAVPARPARRLVIAVKAAMGAADPTKGITTMTDRDASDHEPHSSSPTDHVLTELQLYGHRPRAVASGRARPGRAEKRGSKIKKKLDVDPAENSWSGLPQAYPHFHGL
jgi:hypothetical protein